MNNKRFLKTVKGAIIVGVLCIGLSVTASVLMNWTGAQSVVETKQFITTATDKIIAQENLVNKLKQEKTELEDRLEELENNNNQSPDGSLTEEIEDLRQQIIDKNNQIVDLENQIISKQNDIEHLLRELTRANTEVAEQKAILDECLTRLEDAGINLYWTEE